MMQRYRIALAAVLIMGLGAQAQSPTTMGRPANPDDPMIQDSARELLDAVRGGPYRGGEFTAFDSGLFGIYGGSGGGSGGSGSVSLPPSLPSLKPVFPEQPDLPLTPEEIRHNQEIEDAAKEWFEKGRDPFSRDPAWPDESTHIPANPSVTGPQIVAGWTLKNPNAVEVPEIIQRLVSTGFTLEAAACSRYAQWFLDRYDEKGSSFSRLDGYAKSERPLLLQQIQGFEEHCLQGAWPVEREDLLPYLGILVADGRQIVCSATRISDSEIVTARHCVHDSSGNALPWTRLEFRSAVAPNRRIPVTAAPGWKQTPHFDPAADQESDVFLLRGDFPQEEAELRPLRGAPLQSYTQLYLVSVQSLSVLAEEIRRLDRGETANGYLSDGSWPELLRVDSAPTCTSAAVEPPCVAHGCQTQGGVSGAPLFMVGDDGGDIRLPAVHTRHRFRRPKGKCDVLALGLVPNSGLLIRQEAEGAPVIASSANQTTEREGL